MQMAESKIKTFLSLGCLQGEILEEARGNERLRQPLEDNTYYHHESYGMHAQYIRIPVQHIPGCHAKGGHRHDKHTDRHGGERCPLPHHLRDQIDRKHDDQRVYVGVPRRRGPLAGQTKHVFRHRGIQLVLNHPKASNDDDQD